MGHSVDSQGQLSTCLDGDATGELAVVIFVIFFKLWFNLDYLNMLLEQLFAPIHWQ